MTPFQFSKGLGLVSLTFAIAANLLTGCGATGVATSAVATSEAKISGKVFGGQQPVVGAQVYVYGIAGYANSPSNSLMNTGPVTTDANGDFSITGAYTCPSYNTAVDTYILAVGGNPGLSAGTNNSAIKLMAALGPCNGLSSNTFININEVSTAAAVTALQQFMTSATAVDAPPNQIGIENAFLTVANLVDLGSGTALLSTPTGQGIAPQAKLNTLGNILAACVNSASPSSSGCSALFAAATPTGGTAPTDTVQAMLNIAQNPGQNVATLYGTSSTVAPFAPALTSAPNDFTLSIQFTGGGLAEPTALAVDVNGNIYMTSCATCVGATGADAVIGYSPVGTVLTGAAGYTTDIHKPSGIALDVYNNIWTTNLASGSTPDEVNRTDSSGNENQGSWPLSGSNLLAPSGIAITSDYHAWVAAKGSNALTEVYGPGSITQSVTASGFTAPVAVGIDDFGNVFGVGNGSSNILKLNSAGTVVSTTPYSGAGIAAPTSLAVDGGDHVWTIDSSSKAVSEIFGYDGTATSGASGYSGINTGGGIAIAGDGTAWITNCRASCAGSGSTAADNIVHLSTSGASLTASDGYQSSSLATPGATVIDYSGNVWVANKTGASLTELVGVASPVLPNLMYETMNGVLPAAQLLGNPGFEAAGTGTYVPSWTLTTTPASTSSNPIAYTEGNAHTGSNRLSYYSGSGFAVDSSQTLTVANGKYLVSCWATGASSNFSNVSLTVTGYDSTPTDSMSVSLLSAPVLSGSWQLYSVPNVPVTSGSLTVNLDATSPNGGTYMSWDDCSVTKQ